MPYLHLAAWSYHMNGNAVPNILWAAGRGECQQGTVPNVVFQLWLEASMPKDTLHMRSGREALLGRGSLCQEPSSERLSIPGGLQPQTAGSSNRPPASEASHWSLG